MKVRELIGLLVEYADDLDDDICIGGIHASEIREVEHKVGRIWLQPLPEIREGGSHD